MKKWLFAIVVIWSFIQCVPENKKILTEVKIDLGNPEIKRIIDFQNEQNLDSISDFLNHRDPSMRYLASQSFASYQNALALNKLYPLLQDPILKVRTSAAYAIGQIGKRKSQDSLLMAFKRKDTIDVDNIMNGTLLESIGKLGDINKLKLISTANSYRADDTILLLNQARSIYRFMINGITAPEGTSKIIELLTNDKNDPSIRLYAANYLARVKDVDLNPFKFQINQHFNEASDPNIKMALATALGKVDDPQIEENLISQLNLKLDYRVTCNVIRSLKKSSYIKVAEKLLDKLDGDNRHIALLAADYFRRNGNKDDATFYRNYANDSLHYLVKAKMFIATLDNLPYYYGKSRNATRNQIQKLITNTKNPLEIKAYLEALSHDPISYEWIYDNLFSSEIAGIQTACIEAFGTILNNDQFEFYFKSSSNIVRRKIIGYIKEAMETGDEGAIGAGADIIANEKAGLKTLIDSTEFLTQALLSLKMPGQVESINAVEKALGYLANQPNIDLSKPTTFKPINWSIFNELGDSVQALVKTNQGVFTFKLFMKESPASVLNFISLANENFYNDKIFHRVVPNFVIQTGSPRADNYGGKDYVIRSELSQQYYDDEGYVGMASAGNHTESTQWFVTHSPTPHLDGKYTIVGKVTEGMDVVHKISQGDKILEVIISNL